MAVTCYDLLRVWAGYESSVLDKWDLGRLARALSEYGVQSASAEKPLGNLPQWSMFMSSLGVSRELRNDLVHAWPVRHGLLRHGSRYIAADEWPFYTVKSLEDVTASFELTSRLGNGVALQRRGCPCRGLEHPRARPLN